MKYNTPSVLPSSKFCKSLCKTVTAQQSRPVKSGGAESSEKVCIYVTCQSIW